MECLQESREKLLGRWCGGKYIVSLTALIRVVDGVEYRSRSIKYREFSCDCEGVDGLLVRSRNWCLQGAQRLVVIWGVYNSEARCIYELDI